MSGRIIGDSIPRYGVTASTSAAQQRAAMKVVAAHALGFDDLRDLLRALGLLDGGALMRAVH